uniref:Endonuclease n=1 Tax=Ditylenchus dipsaci TaxID=166011 RepID=A0A915EJK6_9BILA
MVVEHLTPDRLVYDPSVGRSKSTFKPDTSIHTFFQSQNSDYLRSGYDREHLAAAGNHRKSRNSIDQTFFLTNMSPHVGRGFNRDKWNDVEIHVRRLAKKNRNVYICTGPLYLPQKESDGNFYTFPKSILCSMINYFNRFRHYLTDTAPLSSSNAETEEEEDEMLPARRRDAESGSKSKSSSSYRTPSSTTPKLKRSETERPYKPAPKTSTQSNAMESSEESSKEESSTARLSRRSSVLGDLFALFRRSSSFGLGGRYPAQGYRDHDYDSDDSEDEERQQEMSKEKLLQKIRQNKEIIGKVRMQPWAMKRKRRTLKVAQRQVKHQEARVSKWHLYKVVSSYFIFLRWTVLDFGGFLQYSYMFYGYYSSETYFGNIIKYHVPIAYFCVNLFLLAFCLFIILKKMTSNTRKSKLSGGKQEQYVFTWKAVTGWDYNIGNSETSSSLFKANVIKMREATAEYNKKIKQKWTWLKFFTRLVVNFVILCMFAMSVVAIYQVAQITEKDTFIKQNAVSITVALITLLFPPIFELILKLEGYRPRTALRTHLFRVLFFYLINYFTLVYSLFIMLKTLEIEMLDNEATVSSCSILGLLSGQSSYRIFTTNQPSNKCRLLTLALCAFASSSGLETNTFHIVHNPYIHNKTYYEVVPSRSSRHLRKGRVKRPSKNGTESLLPTTPASFIYYSDVPSTTPAQPTPPWTTVYPNYGPFGVALYNPKAIVGPASEKKRKKGKLIFNTVYESRPIGPIAEWSPDGPKTTQGPVALNYTTSPRISHRYAPFRASKYDDLCWETLIGQEIAKIVTTDLVLSIVAIFVIDFLRGLWVRYCSEWWCWNLETTFPEYGEFKVAENVLHLVNNQGMIWLGTILVPMLL